MCGVTVFDFEPDSEEWKAWISWDSDRCYAKVGVGSDPWINVLVSYRVIMPVNVSFRGLSVEIS